MKTVEFSETIAAYDLKVGRCRQLGQGRFLPYIFQVLYVLCLTMPTSGERLQDHWSSGLPISKDTFSNRNNQNKMCVFIAVEYTSTVRGVV